MPTPTRLVEESTFKVLVLTVVVSPSTVKFFEALDYTVVGVSDYDPNVHQPAIIKSNKEKELPEC